MAVRRLKVKPSPFVAALVLVTRIGSFNISGHTALLSELQKNALVPKSFPSTPSFLAASRYCRRDCPILIWVPGSHNCVRTSVRYRDDTLKPLKRLLTLTLH